MPSCRGDKKAKKKQQAPKKATSASSSKPTEAPEITTRASTTTQRANSNNYNYNLRRKPTSTTTTQAPPTTSRHQVNVQPDNLNQHLTPELLAAALKLAREQEKSTTLNSGPSDDHLFQLLQLVKSLGGVDKVQELLNNYNYNKKPLSVGPVDFVNPPANAEIHSHNHHLDSSRLIRPTHENDGPPSILQPSDYAAPQRQNSRGINRQPTTISPFLNPSYVTPRRQIEPLTGSSPVPDYPNLPSLIGENGNANNDLDIPRNSQPRQRRPQRIETTTESIPADQATSRTRSPFSFVYNEPMLRNNAPVAPANSIYENVDESLLAATEPPQRSRSRQRGRTTATTSVIIEPGQPILDSNAAREQPRPRIRGASRTNGNNVPRENIGNLREPNNVDGFFLYSTPTRSSTRHPPIVEPISSLNIQDKPRRTQNSRSRTSEASIGNVYSVPARVTSITNERATGVETAPSSSSTRKKKPAKVRISTGFVVNESPASPGVTYDEEADIYIPFNNEPRSIASGARNSERNGRRNANVNSNPRNSFTHHHSHNVMDSHVINHGPNSIEVPSLSDSPPEPTIISRKPSPIRRRPPQRPHILNNPNAIVEGDYSNQPATSDLEDPFVRNNHLSTTRGTTLNPFSSYSSSSVGLSSLSMAAEHEPTRISSSTSSEAKHSPSIHSLADDLESNYNLHSGGGNTDLFNYNNAVSNTSPVAHSHSPSAETSPNELNTTPYLTTYTTERTIIHHSSNPVTEPAISSTVQTSTQSPSTYLSSSLATSASPSIRGAAGGNLGLSNSGARRGRPRGNSRIVETTPQSIARQTPKRIVASAPVTRAPIISSPAVTPASKPPGSVADGDPITWSQADNKVTCNRRGKRNGFVLK